MTHVICININSTGNHFQLILIRKLYKNANITNFLHYGKTRLATVLNGISVSVQYEHLQTIIYKPLLLVSASVSDWRHR